MLFLLVDDCRFLVFQLSQICINHYFREANYRCANVLTRMDANSDRFYID